MGKRLCRADARGENQFWGDETMTDLATKPIDATVDDTRALDSAETSAVEPPAAAPEPPEGGRRGRKGLLLGLGIPAGLLVAGAAFASTILIAPGVVVAGAPVGFHTAGAAADAISERLAGAEITIGDVTVTGAELGASVDAKAAAEQAFADHPLWNVGAWNPEPIEVPVTIDAAAATETLSELAPELFVAPVDAQVVFDGTSFTAVPAEPGAGLDFEALAADLSAALATGDEIVVNAQPAEVAATTSTAAAEEQAAALNGLAQGAGFYIGEDNALPVDAATLGSWLTVTPNGEGGFAVEADEAAIQQVVDTLPEKVNREPVEEIIITNSRGEHLQVRQEGQDGWNVTNTEGVAADFAAALENGTNRVELQAETVEHETQTLFRRMEVDLSSQTAYAYENEQLVNSWTVSTGAGGTPTDQGHYTVYAYTRIQNMYSDDGSVTEDVPWVTWFNGPAEEAFHGAWWHNSFGTPVSHGCVNMRIADAKWVYDWTTIGTEVWVHS